MRRIKRYEEEDYFAFGAAVGSQKLEIKHFNRCMVTLRYTIS